MVWRFAEAPAKFRSLHTHSGEPDWLVFVPRAMQSPDVDEAIARGAISVRRYDTPQGDIVYIGTALMGLGIAEANAAAETPVQFSDSPDGKPTTGRRAR